MSRIAIVVTGVFLALTTTMAAGAERPGLQPSGDAPDGVIREVRTPGGLAWQVMALHAGVRLVVTGPEDLVFERRFEPVETVTFETTGLPDGQYCYELRVAPMVDATTRERMQESRVTGDDSVIARLKAAGLLPTEPMVRAGTFRVHGESIVARTDDQPAREPSEPYPSGSDREVATKDQVILDDMIVDGSLCVGFDCVNGESFGFDTVRLKENNLRIRFYDTSSTSAFPSNDWQITANDSGNGGANKFSIDDIDAGRSPFTIEAGARNNALYVDSNFGRIGLGTSTPRTIIDAAYGDTPTIRLDQDGTWGWAPYEWDIAANEANFFIRDVTHGSDLVFRIKPGAPHNSLFIASSGNVGLGSESPDARLDIETIGRNAELRLTRKDGTDVTGSWSMTTQNDGRLVLKAAGSSTASLSLGSSGAVTAAGPVNALSDRNAKRDFAPVDPAALLARLATLEIAEWSYATEGEVRHIGPTSQDFQAAFGLGPDDRHITLSDLGGVALAAVQALQDQLDDRDHRIRELEERLESLERRLGTPE